MVVVAAIIIVFMVVVAGGGSGSGGGGGVIACGHKCVGVGLLFTPALRSAWIHLSTTVHGCLLFFQTL